MTDAKEVIASIGAAIERATDTLHNARLWESEGTYDDYISPALSQARDHIDTLTRERDAAVQACRLFVEWMDRDDSGSGVTNEERDTAQGKAQWQAWWDGNMELCGKAMDAARAVVATAQGDA